MKVLKNKGLRALTSIKNVTNTPRRVIYTETKLNAA